MQNRTYLSYQFDYNCILLKSGAVRVASFNFSHAVDVDVDNDEDDDNVRLL